MLAILKRFHFPFEIAWLAAAMWLSPWIALLGDHLYWRLVLATFKLI